MKILFITDSLNRGGAEKQMVLLVTNLQANCEITVWSLHPGPFVQELDSKGVQVLIHQGTSTYRSVKRELSAQLNSLKPDIVHVWGTASLFSGINAFRKAGIPVVNGTIRLGVLDRSLKLKIRMLLSSLLGDLVVANSRSGLDVTRVRGKRGRVIRNGFEWGPVNEAIPLKLNKELFHVTMCANITKVKDYPMFVETAKLISSRYGKSKFKFWALGSPYPKYEMKKILSIAGQLVDDGFMEFTGGVINPFPYLLSSDVGVLLSISGEGISNSLMECMACNLPVICSRSGGNPELVIDGVTGFLVDPNNPPEQVTDKILWLKNHPNKAREMGIAGRERLKNEFSVEKMVNSTMDVYRELL